MIVLEFSATWPLVRVTRVRGVTLTQYTDRVWHESAQRARTLETLAQFQERRRAALAGHETRRNRKQPDRPAEGGNAG